MPSGQTNTGRDKPKIPGSKVARDTRSSTSLSQSGDLLGAAQCFYFTSLDHRYRGADFPGDTAPAQAPQQNDGDETREPHDNKQRGQPVSKTEERPQVLRR